MKTINLLLQLSEANLVKGFNIASLRFWLSAISLLLLSTTLSAQNYVYQFQISNANFNATHDVAVDDKGNIYVVDLYNQRIQKFDSLGRFLTKFGSQGNRDGQFAWPTSVSLDRSGNVYVVDFNNNNIQKFDANGNFLFKFGNAGFGNGEFSRPHGVTVDNNGRIYVLDNNNHRIQVFDANGKFITKFGNYGFGNGQFQFPTGITVDSLGYLYVAGNQDASIQKFNVNGTFVSKFGTYGASEGQFNIPYDVAVDPTGNIFVAERGNHRVQVFNPNGQFITSFGSKGNGEGQLNTPSGVAVDDRGYVYVADTENHRIQVFAPVPCPGIAFFPAPGTLLAPATIGQTYHQAITASAGYSFTATGLPSGLSISREGIISGTPTNTTSSPYVISVRAVRNDCQANANYFLNVNESHQLKSFSLINADTDAAIRELKDKDQIDLDALGYPTLSVRANTEPATVDSVIFELNEPGFSSQAINWNQYQLVGDAFTIDDRYAVSPNERNTKSAVWNKNQINLTHSFDFTFTITDCWEGNGMNFVLQQAGLMALGGYEDHHEGADHGYYNSPTDIFNPSLAVELDFYNNSWGNPNNPYYDPVNMNYHMTFVKNGHPAPISNLVELSTQISNCADRLFRVVWNSSTKQMQVFLDGKLMLSHTEDVVNTIFKGKPQVYFGFTGASGAVSGLETFRNSNLIYNGFMATSHVKVERVLPYALYGDAKGGRDYLGQYWQPGQYTLKATPYWKGFAGLAHSVNFEVKSDLSQALQVNFGNKNTTPPQGWERDYGLAFGEKTFYRYGWKNRDTGQAIDLSLAGSFPGSPGNGRHRSSPKDVLLASLMHMQGNDVKNFRGTPVESYWEVQVENGEYLVTVSVGDGAVYTYTDPESHSINVEGTAAITRFIPQGTQGSLSRFKQAITKVTVSDGYLTLDADGGRNTKINYAIIQPLSNTAAIARLSANPFLQAAETQLPLSIFPNPFSDKVQLTTKLAGMVTVSVYDLMGKSYYQATHQTTTGALLLDLSAAKMKAGVYLLKLQAADGPSQVTKILKE